MSDSHREVGEILKCRISGHETILHRVEGKYDYEKDKCRCPVCGGLGTPWSGMFHCEDGPHKAIIETGECFELLVLAK